MKKILLHIAALALVFGPGSAAYALTVSANASVNVNASTTRGGMMEELKERMMERQNSSSTNKENFLMMMKAKFEHRFDRLFDRLQATIDRENAIRARIETRILKIKSMGGNTTEAEKFSLEAKMHIDEASTSLAALKAAADASIGIDVNASTTEARNARANLRKLAKTVEEHLREGHQALMKTVGSLRGQSQLHATTSANVQS